MPSGTKMLSFGQVDWPPLLSVLAVLEQDEIDLKLDYLYEFDIA